MRALLCFLTSPAVVVREGARKGQGLFALCALLGLEVVVAQPRLWVGALMRLRGAPGAALTMLYGAYTHAALPVLVAMGVLGLARYYWGRARRWPHLDSLAAANAFSYAYLPHVLFVCLGGVLAGLGVNSPWLPQAPLAALSSGAERWLKLAYMFAPSAVCLGIVWRALRPEAALPPQGSLDSATSHDVAGAKAQHPPAKLGAGAAFGGSVMAAGLIATVAMVASHWADYRPRALGEPMPAFAVKGIGRPDIASAQTMGSPLIIDFWATWCPPCIAALPHVQQLHEAYQGRGVRFLAVNIESDNASGVEAFVRAKRLTLPVYIDLDGRMQEAFHVHVYPTTWVVDRDGRIARIYNGSVSPETLRADIERLLQE